MNLNINIKFENPHRGQLKVIRSKAKRKVLMCGRRWGKSLISRQLVIQTALEKGICAYITPSYKLARHFFKEIISALPDSLIDETNVTDLYIKLITGGAIRFFSGEVPDSLRGHSFDLVVIDEAAYIPNLMDVWTQAIQPTLADRDGKAIIISTPRSKGDFYKLWKKGENYELNWESFHYDSYSNPHLAKSVIDEARAELPEEVFRQEYLAIPSSNASCPFKDIDDYVIKVKNQTSSIFGIDVARTFDFSAIVGLKVANDKNTFEQSYQDIFQENWKITKEKIAKLPKKTKKIIDSTGNGDSIYEDLKAITQNIKGFKFTKKSKPLLMQALIKKHELGELRYSKEIAEQMHNMEYIVDDNGIKYKGRGRKKDDLIMALALAVYHLDKSERVSKSLVFKLV